MTAELNGWSVEAMAEAVEGVRQNPESGLLTWRSKVAWDGGFGLDVRTIGIEQMGETMHRHFTMRGDHPPELLGNNTGPTAIETVLAALGACMTGTFAAQATARGVKLDRLELDIEADLDLSGFFGLRPVTPAIQNVKLSYRVEADAERDVLDEIVEAAKSLSPIFNTITRPVAVDVGLTEAGRLQ